MKDKFVQGLIIGMIIGIVICGVVMLNTGLVHEHCRVVTEISGNHGVMRTECGLLPEKMVKGFPFYRHDED